MLEKIIEMANSDSESLFFENERINDVDKKTEELLQRIYKLDKSLANELDQTIGEVTTRYRDECFKVGFLKGLKLSKEMEAVK